MMLLHALRILGVTGLATLFVAAAGTPSAVANPQFHVESAPATIKGQETGTQRFTTVAGTFECSFVSFHGESWTTTGSTLELGACYSGCDAFGFLEATMDMNSCKYVLHLTAFEAPYSASVDIVCPLGSSITLTSPFCVVTIPAQTGLVSTSLANTGSKASRDIDASFNLSAFNYSTSAGCSSGAGTWGLGGMHGSATLRAYKSGTQQGFWIA